jgi:fructokinase
MRRIYGIGETLLDIIFKDGQPIAAKPGGAMLNSMVSLGRIGLPASLISEYGDDPVGKMIDHFLTGNGVDTKCTDHFTEGNTALAIAVLDEKNDASYTFYKKYPSRRLCQPFPIISPGDLILCGSIYAITTEIRQRFIDFISGAADYGGLILYDPNFRKAHASELPELKSLIIENMRLATLVRGSDEDFLNIFGTVDADSSWSIVSEFCNCMVYTANSEGVFVRTKGYSGNFPVRKINPVSTIGAGDNFNAGMIAAIYRSGIKKDELCMMGEEKWKVVVSTGVDFASDVCMSYENYISTEFAARFK